MIRKAAVKLLVSVFLLLLVSSTAFANQEIDFAVNEVEVTRDDKGVWFITGPEDAPFGDIFMAMGYSVAKDRLWQMELYRRSATGRMAEILGKDFLETDIFIRTLGYTEGELTAAFDQMDEDVKDIIQGYVNGVNQRLSEIATDPTLMPFEFAAIFSTMGVPPQSWDIEEWTVNQVLAWTALMQRSFDPEALDTGQLDNLEFLGRLNNKFPETGFQMFNDLRWTNDPSAPSVIDHKKRFGPIRSYTDKSSFKQNFINFTSDMKQRRERIMKALEKVNARVKMGSYAWVVSGDKTQSGNPIIYSGPQMGFSVPSIVTEGSINAGGLNISGMTIPGIPEIIIGRTPHHAWSMQVGHAHTTDYYFDSPDSIKECRDEEIIVAGEIIPRKVAVCRTGHGPIVGEFQGETETVVVSWKYSHWNYELNNIEGFLELARAKSIDHFGDALKDLGVSQHFCYADCEGNIAYWMSGRDPVRDPGEWRLPQGSLGSPPIEWDTKVVKDLSHDRNTPRGWYGGWNNKTGEDYPSGFNGIYTIYGPFHRAHAIYDYFDSKLRKGKKLSFEKIRDLAMNIATTYSFYGGGKDSIYGGGNPWKFVQKDFMKAVFGDGWNRDRFKAIWFLNRWDGHFVAGGEEQWAEGSERAKAWVFMDRWIDEVINLTFFDELAVVDPKDGQLKLNESHRVLFNVLLHGLEYPGSLRNNYNWFQNIADPSAPQDEDSIILAALDKVLDEWKELPAEAFARGVIEYEHDMLGLLWTTPASNRSTYAHCVEYGEDGPVRIESMFPLGESGHIGFSLTGNAENPIVPVFDDHFFSMTPEFDSFKPREFSLPE